MEVRRRRNSDSLTQDACCLHQPDCLSVSSRCCPQCRHGLQPIRYARHLSKVEEGLKAVCEEHLGLRVLTLQQGHVPKVLTSPRGKHFVSPLLVHCQRL